MRFHDPTIDVTNTDEMMRFHNWLIAMGDGMLPSIALDGEDEATWITIPEDLLIPIDDNPVEAIGWWVGLAVEAMLSSDGGGRLGGGEDDRW
ncbi:replication factor A protein 1 [Tanacetum coccineum]